MDNIDGWMLGYIAGFFDGEGSVTIPMSSFKWRSSACLSISMVNTNLEILELISGTIGGNIGPPHLMGGNRKPIYSIRWFSWDAAMVLDMLYPYLVVKRRQAEIGIKYQETFCNVYTSNGLPLNIKEERIALGRELGKLNKKGVGKACG